MTLELENQLNELCCLLKQPIPQISKLHIVPGDIIVLTYDGRLGIDQYEKIVNTLKYAFSDVYDQIKIIILDDGMRLQVLHGDDE